METKTFAGSFILLTVLSILALSETVVASPSEACRRAYRGCDFKFEGAMKIPRYDINVKADRPFTRRIAAKNGRILGGVFNSNGREAEFINRDGTVVKISKVGRAHPRYTRTHFKPYYMHRKRGSGIGHQVFRENQKKIAKGRCVRVYFTQYQTLKSRYPLVVDRNIHTSEKSKCVVFMTK